MKNSFDKQLFFVLWALGAFGAAAAMPYLFTVQAEALAAATQELPLVIIALLSLTQSAVIFGILIAIGLFVATRAGFQFPLLTACLYKEKNPLQSPEYRSWLWKSALLGTVAAIAIVALDWLFAQFGTRIAIADAEVPELWKRFLASFYGGITEELLMRLFLVSIVAFVLGKLFKKAPVVAYPSIMWPAIFFAAVVFGLGHLPLTATLTALTPLVILRAILLNGIGGVLFGWLYWKKGLEYAVIAHFAADIMLHVVLFSLVTS